MEVKQDKLHRIEHKVVDQCIDFLNFLMIYIFFLALQSVF